MAKNKKKYYAVACGRNPGIYSRWFGPGGAHEQVNGFARAVYKGFATLEEARSWLATDPQPWSGAGQNRRQKKKTETPTPKLARTDPERLPVYTDGGALGNPGPGGWGAVLVTPDGPREFSGGFRLTTNNRMELMACIMALEEIKEPTAIELFTDSRYVANGITLGWARSWQKKGWMRTAKEPAKNADLWAKLLVLCDFHDVAFTWVKGHANNPGNERCDQLVKIAAQKTDLPIDKEYERQHK